ncbi:hypothetical protein BJ508DRAFT_212931, partial [Ascobolus immersus RN42]
MPPVGGIKKEDKLQSAFEKAERAFQAQPGAPRRASGSVKREPVYEDPRALFGQPYGVEVPAIPYPQHQAPPPVHAHPHAFLQHQQQLHEQQLRQQQLHQQQLHQQQLQQQQLHQQQLQQQHLHQQHLHQQHLHRQPQAHPRPEPQQEPITFNFRAALEDRPVEVLEEVVGKATNLLDEIKKAVNECGRTERRGNFDNTMLIKQIDEARSKSKQAKTIIGVVGNTGAGKSSVINALLDEEKIVPTNCMRACTAVVTEISYNYDTEDKYRAEIEFISKKDWEDELNVLFDDILNSGDFDRESGRPDTEAGIAWSKVKAIYPRVTKPEFKENGVQYLMAQPAVNRILGTTIDIKEENNLTFYQKLQKYIDSKEKNKKKVADMTEYEKEHRFDMEYWPLIRVVRLYLKSEVLKTGAVLVDLPGVHDANAARAAVAERYMMQCSAIWVVAPITRAVDDKSAKDLLGATFKRQLYMDGGYSTVTFLCSKSDDISVDEAIDSLHLEDSASAYTNKLDQLREQRAKLVSELKDIKSTVKAMEKEYESQDELKDQYEEWRDQVEAGETVYAPEEKKQSNKRKRGSSDESGGRRKAARVDSDIESDADFVEADDASEQEGADEETAIDLEDEDERPKKALTLEEIDEKVHQLSASLKEAKKLIRETKRGATVKESERISVDKEINKLQNELTVFCIQQRNAYSKEALKRDFALGLKEVDDQHAEEEDPDNFDPSKPLRDYAEVEKSFPVFCVSSRAYQKLCGRLNKDGKATSFADASETEIPALQTHCVTATVKHRKATALQFLNVFDQLLNSLSMWSIGSGNAVLDKRQFTQISAFVADRIAELDEALWNNAMNVVDGLKDTAQKRLYSVFPAAAASACKAAEPSIAKMDNYHWCTYKALMRRQGVFTNARNGAMNVNGTLCEPVIKTVTVPWGKFFQTELNESFQNFWASIHSTLYGSLQSLYPKFPALGLGEFQKQMLERQIEGLRTSARDDINGIVEFINNRQKEINRMFEGSVREYLSGTYTEVASQSGSGMWSRMRMLMHSEIKNNKVDLFNSTIKKVEEQLKQMFGSIED